MNSPTCFSSGAQVVTSVLQLVASYLIVEEASLFALPVALAPDRVHG